MKIHVSDRAGVLSGRMRLFRKQGIVLALSAIACGSVSRGEEKEPPPGKAQAEKVSAPAVPKITKSQIRVRQLELKDSLQALVEANNMVVFGSGSDDCDAYLMAFKKGGEILLYKNGLGGKVLRTGSFEVKSDGSIQVTFKDDDGAWPRMRFTRKGNERVLEQDQSEAKSHESKMPSLTLMNPDVPALLEDLFSSKK